MPTVFLLLAGIVTWLVVPPTASAGTLFKDGFLGLTQPELRTKLGPPHRIRIRMGAQRVFGYYSLEAWETDLKETMTGSLAEDVYVFTRDKIPVRYSFQFIEENKPNSDAPTLIVNLVDVEFLIPDPQTGAIENPVTVPYGVPVGAVPKLVPEFQPSFADDAPAYQSNLFIVLVQDQAAKEARRLVKERVKADYDWALSYRLYTTEGFPPRISWTDTVNRIEFTIDSLGFIKDHYKLTHDLVVNPFSPKAASLPPPPDQVKKNIPKPRYAP
jgi:hypothetical protein